MNTASYVTDVVKRASKHVDQVIVIDDGSEDNTALLARRAGALVVNHNVNLGYGGAIKSCIEEARSRNVDVLVILDGDRQHDPEEIPQVLAPILEGRADLAVGSRFITYKHNMPLYRRFGIKVINFLWNLGSRVKVSDTQSGFRAYNRAALSNLSLSESGMSASIEILEDIRRSGLVIREVPISCVYGRSRPNAFAIKHGLAVAFSVGRIRIKAALSRSNPSESAVRHDS
ncbi:glycosyltransferase family 2 protein [Chloroflexota bacterium]